MGEATTDLVRLPPGRGYRRQSWVSLSSPRASCGRCTRQALRQHVHGEHANFGEAVVISDPVLIKDLFTTSSDLVGRNSILETVLGPGSTFSLDGDEHRARRKLLVPPLHGKRMAGYDAIVEEEVMRRPRPGRRAGSSKRCSR